MTWWPGTLNTGVYGYRLNENDPLRWLRPSTRSAAPDGSPVPLAILCSFFLVAWVTARLRQRNL
jgi:hypothetical protein